MSLTDSKHNGNSMGSTHKHDSSITGPSQCPVGKFCSITAEEKSFCETIFHQEKGHPFSSFAYDY